jgi:hypothetical protein
MAKGLPGPFDSKPAFIDAVDDPSMRDVSKIQFSSDAIGTFNPANAMTLQSFPEQGIHDAKLPGEIKSTHQADRRRQANPFHHANIQSISR